MFLSLKTLYRKRTVIWPFYFYTIIRTLSKFLQHDLLFKINGSKILKTEFNNKSLSDKYKNKNVDLFGTNYYNQCYFSLDNMELNDGRLIEKNVYVWRCDRA